MDNCRTVMMMRKEMLSHLIQIDMKMTSYKILRHKETCKIIKIAMLNIWKLKFFKNAENKYLMTQCLRRKHIIKQTDQFKLMDNSETKVARIDNYSWWIKISLLETCRINTLRRNLVVNWCTVTQIHYNWKII